jgi:multidrug efflux pump subunit AcrA (membrane-fusion protein)
MIRACNPGAGALNISPLAKRRAVEKRANFEPCTRPGLRRLKLLSISLAGLALGLAGCNQQKGPPSTALNLPQVVVATVEQREVPIVREWIGRLDGSQNVDIRARVQGYIQQILFREGTVVKAGDIL